MEHAGLRPALLLGAHAGALGRQAPKDPPPSQEPPSQRSRVVSGIGTLASLGLLMLVDGLQISPHRTPEA